MRPLKLTLEGFSGFRDRAEIDFSDADLIAFVGPTGSGKSSIVDGITFALYGSVPRYSSSSSVAPAIHQLENQARIALDFEVAGTTYTAVRVIRRTQSGATTREARLESGDQVLAGRAGEMDEAVQSVIGLSYSQFVKTVVLPQGDFAEFLHDTPGERQKLLKRLLDLEVYESMARTARREATTRATEIGILEKDLEGDQPTAEGLVALEARQSEINKAREAASELLERHRNLTEKRHATQGLLATLTSRIKALEGLDIPEGLDSVHDANTEAQKLHDAAATRVEALDEVFNAHIEALEASPNPTDLALALQKHARLGELNEELPELSSELEKVAAELESATNQHHDTDGLLDSANERVGAAERLAGAGAFLAALEVGEPCPICAQTVSAVPEHDPDAELAASRKEVAALRKELKSRGEAVSVLRSKSDGLSQRREERTAEAAALRTELAGAPSEDELKKSQANAEKLQQAVKEARSELHNAQSELKKLQKELDAARDALAKVASTLVARRESLLREGFEPPPTDTESVLRSYEALADWGESQRVTLSEEHTAATAEAADLESEIRRLNEEVRLLCEPVAIEATIESLGEELSAAAAAAAEKVSNYAERLAEANVRQERIAQAKASQALHTEMGRLLSSGGFERWLLAEAMVELAERASGRLHDLSDQQYSLKVDDDTFKVVDHRNADELRDVRTLSGGETFLASLALALALAESISAMASAGAPRLESVFLDEGFGTLDADALDSVATAIEELGSDRLVGVVTHVKDLADRIPVRFAVSRDARTSKVERVEL